MQFGKLNRTGAENMYRTILNVEGATITTGLPVSIRPTAASIDGISAVIANSAADYIGFIGIATEDIANNDYGRVQVNGVVNSVLLSNAGTSITITAGDYLLPGPKGFYSAAVETTFSGNGGYAYNYKTVQAISTGTVSALGYVKGLIAVL